MQHFLNFWILCSLIIHLNIIIQLQHQSSNLNGSIYSVKQHVSQWAIKRRQAHASHINCQISKKKKMSPLVVLPGSIPHRHRQAGVGLGEYITAIHLHPLMSRNLLRRQTAETFIATTRLDFFTNVTRLLPHSQLLDSPSHVFEEFCHLFLSSGQCSHNYCLLALASSALIKLLVQWNLVTKRSDITNPLITR